MSKSRKRRKRKGSSFKFEAFLINYGLQTAGIILIVAGLVYLFISGFNIRFLLESWKSFLHYSPENVTELSTTGSDFKGYLSLLYLVPGTLLVILALLLKRIPARVKNILLVLGFVMLITAEAKVLLDIRNHVIELNYYLILVTYFSIQIIVTASAMAGKSRITLNLAVVFLFVSLILIRLIYGVIIPNIISLMIMQTAVSIYCYKFKLYSPFVLLMTFSMVYVTYYYVKMVLIAGSDATLYAFMQPGLLVWFILSATGFGILNPGLSNKVKAFVWNNLPYATLMVVLMLSLGFYYKAGINYLYLIYYSLAVIALICIAFLNRKYNFIANGDAFYFSVCIFSAFLVPQFFYPDFFLILPASLAVVLLINVLLTDLKTSLTISVWLYFISLGLYMARWAFTIIPALLLQRATGIVYPLQLILSSLLFFALAYYYYRQFNRILKGYAFSYTQNKKLKNAIEVVFQSIVYLTGFQLVDYILIQILPGYRVNYIEWGIYTYSYLYFLFASQNLKSKRTLRNDIILSVLAVIAYITVIHPEAIHFRTLYLAGESGALLPFLLHYLCLGIIVVVMLHVNERLKALYPKSRFSLNSRTLLGILFLCFILLSEYDHLFLLMMNRFGSQPAYEILQYNKFIPYSIILLSVSVALLVFSLVRYTRFLRRLSMFMILAVLLKVLFVDILILPAGESILLLITLGAILLILSLLVPRLRKQAMDRKSQDAGKS